MAIYLTRLLRCTKSVPPFTLDQKVFGMYRSVIINEGEEIRSIPFKHILIFVGLVVCAGLIFRFGFMEIFHNYE